MRTAKIGPDLRLTGPRRQGGEQEQAQYRTNHDVLSGWSCRRPEKVSILSSLMNWGNPRLINPYCRGECKAVYQAPAPHNTCGSCWLETAQQFYHDMRGEDGSRVTSKLRSSQDKRTPQDTINKFIIRKLNPLLVVDFRFISAFLHAQWSVNSHAR